MQLERIRIANLFGRFNYDITLRRAEKITIIHAPNGFGKTVILTLVNSFFSESYTAFFKYQFTKLTLYFENDQRFEINKSVHVSTTPGKKPPHLELEELTISLFSQNSRPKSFQVLASESSPQLNRFLPFLEPVGPDLWLDETDGEVMTSSEAIAYYGDHLTPAMRRTPNIPDWFRQFIRSSECRLIETQRLLRITRQDDNLRPSRRRSAPTRAVVDFEARDLANRIGLTLADYANRSQSLDQSFPRRVIDALDSAEAPAADDVSLRLRNVNTKRLSLIEAGLLDKSGAPEILSQAELEEQRVRQVIGIYLNDMEQKFSRFDQLFERVSLFKEIIGEKFQFKNVAISRDKGIGVKAESGADIPLPELSSGEQHELVLLYELLFGVKDDALILIDEPELSLHIVWQMKFLPDLQRIQKIRPFQIVIATHSPQIINDRWDLTEELKSQ
jgi:predicted ATP-binding protein involved in virulence